MVSQFSPEGDRPTLSQLGDLPKDVYPVGRLDADSEGLLILTNDSGMNAELLQPARSHIRTYYIQVEGKVSDKALDILRSGVDLSIKGKKFTSLPAKAERLEVPDLPERTPPIRFRKNVPDSWVALSLVEGKNRQVRRMTAAVGFPTLRLVRFSIEKLNIEGMVPGDIREISKAKIREDLNIFH